VDAASSLLPGMALPLRHGPGSVATEMTASAFLPKQAGLEEQGTGALAVVEVEQQIQVPPTGLL